MFATSPHMAKRPPEDDVKVCTVIGFPHGSHRTDVKVFESERAMDDGATELDMVCNIGKVLTGALDPGFVRLHPVRMVPTYTNLGLSPNLPGASRDGSMNRQEIEKLKSLGYIF